jgi:hypothetical protein
LVREEDPVVKRSLVALASAALLLSAVALPVAAGSAMPVGEVDQSNPTTGDIATTMTSGQTFTAGVTGQLTQVDLWAEYATPQVVAGQAAPNPAGGISVQIYATAGGLPIGTALGSAGGAAIAGPGWVSFTLSPAIPVLTGIMYAFSFSPGTDTGVFVGTAYSRGTALTFSGSAWSNNTARDYAFRTHVYHQFTEVQWSQGQVLGGASTNINFLETFTLPGSEPGAVGTAWTLNLTALPSWFTATSVSCSANVTDCLLSNVEGHMHTAADQTSAWVRIYGTAAPLEADIGTNGTGAASGCLVAVGFDNEPMFCISASADVAVVSVITTPPPGTTSSEPLREGDSGAWLVPGAIVGLLGVAFALNRRRLLEH